MQPFHTTNQFRRPRRPLDTPIGAALVHALGKIWVSDRPHPLIRRFREVREPLTLHARRRSGSPSRNGDDHAR